MRSWLAIIMAGLVLAGCKETTDLAEGDELILPDPPRKSLTIPAQTRGAWVVRTTLKDRAAVKRIVDEAVVAGFNTLVVQVRGRGDAFFRDGLEPVAAFLNESTFDPLEEITRFAHARGVRVHAWVNSNLVADVGAMPAAPEHVVNSHPEWLQVPEKLQRDLLSMGARDARFVPMLVQHGELEKGTVEGLYGDPAVPEYRAHLAAIAADIARRYPVDGIHLDYIRYPGPSYGVSTRGFEVWRMALAARLTAKESTELREAEQADPAYSLRKYPQAYANHRREAVNAMVFEVQRMVRAVRPDVHMSAAVFPDPESCRERQFQDWRLWLREGWIDTACPMNYAPERGAFDKAMQAELLAHPQRIWVGIGSWRISVAESIDRMAAALRHGAGGTLLFSHGGLTEQPRAFQALGEAAPRSPARD
jgi:uncharacterized lipoprotein YddW (UPF0748 family)